PQASRVSKVRLSVATTEAGGTSTVWVPRLSSTSTVPDCAPSPPASEQAEASSAVPRQEVRSRPKAPAAEYAPRRRREIAVIGKNFLSEDCGRAARRY